MAERPPDNKRTRIEHDPADAVPPKRTGLIGRLRDLLRDAAVRRTSTKR